MVVWVWLIDVWVWLIVSLDAEGGYWFFADSARDADEWIRVLSCARFERGCDLLLGVWSVVMGVVCGEERERGMGNIPFS